MNLHIVSQSEKHNDILFQALDKWGDFSRWHIACLPACIGRTHSPHSSRINSHVELGVRCHCESFLGEHRFNRNLNRYLVEIDNKYHMRIQRESAHKLGWTFPVHQISVCENAFTLLNESISWLFKQSVIYVNFWSNAFKNSVLHDFRLKLPFTIRHPLN